VGVAALAFAIVLLANHAWGASANLVDNAALTRLAGSNPAGWQTQAWLTAPGISSFGFKPTPEGGVLTVTNLKPNDGRWVQHLHLGPGWYHFTADLSTSNVGMNNTGGALCLLQYWISSPDLRGTNTWQPTGFYLKVGKSGADVDLACRLGGYSSTNTGTLQCRDIRGVKVASAPANDRHAFDLESIAASQTPPPPTAVGGDRSLVLLLIGVSLLLVVIGWRHIRTRSSGKGGTRGPDSGGGLLTRLAARREIEIALFLVSFLSFAYFYQASDHSTASRIDLIRALTERGTVWIDWYAGFNTADIVQMHSHIYSNKAPGGALTGLVPWVVVTTGLRAFLAPGPWFWALATYLTTVFSVSLISALCVVLTYRMALELGAAEGRAVAVALVLAFGTILFPHASEFTAEPIAAFCVFAAFYLLVRARPEDSLRIPLLAGLLAGWSVVCDYPTFILAAVVGTYALWKLRTAAKVGSFAAGAGIMALLLATYDLLAFGNPFFLSYEAYMLPGSDRFKAQAVGFAGVTYPHLNILWNVLFAPQRGLFFCNPVLLLMIPGLFFMWQRRMVRGEFVAIAAAIVAFILFNGSYGDSVVYWGGGTATGPRHIISALPFMVLPIAFLPAIFDYLFGLLALVSVFCMVMATAIEPHLPYEYLNPFRDFLWPAYLRGDFAYNKGAYFGGPPLLGDSVAFNLGKLARLPGWAQLIPLLALWLGFGRRLLRMLQPPPSLARGWAAVAAAAGLVAIFSPPVIGAVAMHPELDAAHGLLGRYYEGLQPGVYRPHLERIDSSINLDDNTQMGSLPYPSSAIWTGSIYAPSSGTYNFVIEADDNGWMSLDGRPVIADPGDITRLVDEGSTYLTAGWHSIKLGQRNIWGGESMHLFWQPPGEPQQLVPSQDLRPPSALASKGQSLAAQTSVGMAAHR
jgi:hypothetical protein